MSTAIVEMMAALEAIAEREGASAALAALKVFSMELAGAVQGLLPHLTEDERDSALAAFGPLLMLREVGAEF